MAGILSVSVSRRQFLSVATLVSFVLCVYTLLRIPSEPEYPPARIPTSLSSHNDSLSNGPLPKPAPGTSSHPMLYLIQDAEREFQHTRDAQSRTLKEAVAEYRRRYGLPPPPHFDKWFAFATANRVQLVDEFDTIHDLMTPFWGLKPKTIRARAREALGFDNGLLGVAVRNHEIAYVQGGPEWQQNATKGMMAKFLKYLPDMDLAFNIHDEPRVVLSHEDLERLRQKATQEKMPAALASRPSDAFSTHADLHDGSSFKETTVTRFNTYSRQPTWSDSRISCPPDTPARELEEDEMEDQRSSYAMGDLGFVYNTTAMSDICLTPSLRSTFGFFDGPNTFKVVHDLFPIFSQSKMSSYSDVVYPSPWYWSNMVPFDEGQDVEWDRKERNLYWRGSTTGGYSRNGRWRRQHRQRLVQKMNAPDQAKIMVNGGTPSQPRWTPAEVPRGEHRGLVDVHFSHVGQCDPGDCDAQAEFFQVANYTEQHDAWSHRYLLDVDGNAFSGRFHAFLRSRSLVFKMAVFREWHAEWLRPWKHYVPLSAQGDEWLEAVRYMDGEGGEQAERMAAASRDWAEKAVRQVDMEAWLFRLLLEYARVIDDNRAAIGFS